MELGWIDFSAKDRKRAIDVIHLLQDKGAVDELGIGIVRDAFANMFFPGTSTVQTRAKYFLIIPYIIKECCENPRNTSYESVKRMIDEREKTCACVMQDHGETDGIIGIDVIPDHWVVRKPYSIYWNGIRTFGIFTDNQLSLDEYINIMLRQRNKTSISNWTAEGEEYEQDDRYAGDVGKNPYWNLPSDYSKDWQESLTIQLTPCEAEHLKDCILKLKGTLLEFILSNGIDMSLYSAEENQFRALYINIKNDLSDDLRRKMQLAIKFDSLVYLCRILYNQMLSDNENSEANQEWENYHDQGLEDIENLNLDAMLMSLNIEQKGTSTFLKNVHEALIADNVVEAKNLILQREKGLKGESRAKLMNKNAYPTDKWIGGHHLDYRMNVTTRLLKDINDGIGGQNV